MKTNEGTLDRTVRVIAGVVLIGLAATGTIGMWGYIGVVPLLTGSLACAPCTRYWASIAVPRIRAEVDRHHASTDQH